MARSLLVANDGFYWRIGWRRHGWPGWTDWTDGTGLTDWAGLDGKKHPGLMAILNTELHIIEVVRLFHQSISS